MIARRGLLKWGAFSIPALPTLLLSVLQSRADTESTEKWYWYPGHYFTIKATGKDTANTCAWMLVENSPREGVPFHKHLFEDESFYIIEGQFEITVDDRTITGGPGTFAYGPRNVPHRWTNTGSGRGRILSVLSPSGLENYFLSVAVPVSNPGEKPAIDIAEFQAKTTAARQKFGIVRTGPLKYPTA
jgi:quercetin dioxygenase-like cupin family protein